jgi:hypothetical protein
MSVLPISHFSWQLLRTAKRSKVPLTGKQLRLAPHRRTKDGTFLDDLVAEGLLELVGVDDPTEKTKKWPVQFRRRYRLTGKGEYAAEYGEYDRQVQPANAPEQPPPPLEKGNKRRKGAGR